MPEGLWVDAMACEDIEGDFPEAVTLHGKDLAIYRCGERFYATAGRCTHEGAKLCDGYLEGEVIECPLHQARFSIVTGEVLSAPATERLVVYPVRIRDGRIFVQLDAGSKP